MITIHPNPVSEKLTVNIISTETAKYIMILIDIYGKKVASLIKNINVGNNTADFDASELSNGTYFLYIDNGTEIQKNKVVIAR